MLSNLEGELVQRERCKESILNKVWLGMDVEMCGVHDESSHAKKNRRREYQLIMTVSLFLTGRHGQPQNNREGPETGRGL